MNASFNKILNLSVILLLSAPQIAVAFRFKANKILTNKCYNVQGSIVLQGSIKNEIDQSFFSDHFAKFASIEEWNQTREYLNCFGEVYVNETIETEGGTYKERRLYAYKLAIRMNAIQEASLVSSPENFYQIGVQSRLFLESALSIFARAKEGWPRKGWMVGSMLKYLEEKYPSNQNFLSFCESCRRINFATIKILHEHGSEYNKGYKAENFFNDLLLVAIYIKDNLKNVFKKDDLRIQSNLSSTIHPVILYNISTSPANIIGSQPNIQKVNFVYDKLQQVECSIADRMQALEAELQQWEDEQFKELEKAKSALEEEAKQRIKANRDVAYTKLNSWAEQLRNQVKNEMSKAPKKEKSNGLTKKMIKDAKMLKLGQKRHMEDLKRRKMKAALAKQSSIDYNRYRDPWGDLIFVENVRELIDLFLGGRSDLDAHGVEEVFRRLFIENRQCRTAFCLNAVMMWIVNEVGDDESIDIGALVPHDTIAKITVLHEKGLSSTEKESLVRVIPDMIVRKEDGDNILEFISITLFHEFKLMFPVISLIDMDDLQNDFEMIFLKVLDR